MKPLSLSLFFLIISLYSVIAATNTFDPATNTLTINSVTVTGDRVYSNVTIRIDAFTVLGVGSSAPITEGVSETCSAGNFSVDIFNAIQTGMTVEQVTQIIGCRSEISLRSEDFLRHSWAFTNELRDTFSISVIFDPSTLTVHETVGSFKTATGF
ncbi:MAG: hypothetical protein K0U40_11310 [Betaproteobacteria bacterium]|nr:hypothetical protein [Betaproteobacteria bacterium]